MYTAYTEDVVGTYGPIVYYSGGYTYADIARSSA